MYVSKFIFYKVDFWIPEGLTWLRRFIATTNDAFHLFTLTRFRVCPHYLMQCK